jgi:hypothetical protein
VELAAAGKVDLDKVKRFTEEIQPEFSKKLLEWHTLQCKRLRNDRKFKAVTNQVAMMTKASSIAKDLGLNWLPSNGWFGRWKELHCLKCVTLHCKGDDVVAADDETVKASISKLHDKLKEFKADNIFNMDETRLMFELLPTPHSSRVHACRNWHITVPAHCFHAWSTVDYPEFFLLRVPCSNHLPVFVLSARNCPEYVLRHASARGHQEAGIQIQYHLLHKFLPSGCLNGIRAASQLREELRLVGGTLAG